MQLIHLKTWPKPHTHATRHVTGICISLQTMLVAESQGSVIRNTYVHAVRTHCVTRACLACELDTASDLSSATVFSRRHEDSAKLFRSLVSRKLS
jgi:hypothetical protein